MKLIIINILTMFLLASCSDSARVRGDNSKVKGNIPLSHADESLRTDEFEFTRMFISEIFVPVKISNNTITIEDDMADVDEDHTYSCAVRVSKDTQLRFEASDYKLKLSNSSGVMNFDKSSGFQGEGIHGTWEMLEVINQNHIITEVEFNNDIYMRLRKTCKIK